MPSRFVVCASKEEAIEAAEAGLLWLNLSPTGFREEWRPWRNLNVADRYGSDTWPPTDFAVLVEE